MTDPGLGDCVVLVRDLKKKYRTPEGVWADVLDVPHFQISAGQHLALEGHSGSGKTTFLNLIAGILRADAGSIRIVDTEICGTSESERDHVRASNIGYVFQTFNLLQGYTALENVLLGMAFGRGVDQAWGRSLLTRVGLSDRCGYRPGQLSVGQQQRVALARALANNPKLVLADEPTANLDARRAGEAITLLREIVRESSASLLLVSHDKDVLAGFESVRRMSDLNRASCATSDVSL